MLSYVFSVVTAVSGTILKWCCIYEKSGKDRTERIDQSILWTINLLSCLGIVSLI